MYNQGQYNQGQYGQGQYGQGQYGQGQYYQQPQQQQQQQQQDVVSGEQYRYALANFRIAHEKVEAQRQQLEEQEKQVALLKQRIAVLEGGDDQGAMKPARNQGGFTVDDFSIRNAASKLERLINRWAAEVIRTPPAPLPHLCQAALTDLSGNASPEAQSAASVVVQSLLRHAMAEVISEGIINVMVVTNSNEANIHLTRIHEHIFGRDPTVASVWRRQTFSAAVEQCSPELSSNLLFEHIPGLAAFLTNQAKLPSPGMQEILEEGYALSRMLHGTKTTSGGVSDAFYRTFVPELGSTLLPRQIELVKRCLKSESGETDKVGACVFPGLVKMSKGPPTMPGVNAAAPEILQTVVRRAQVICECALATVGNPAAMGAGMGPPMGVVDQSRVMTPQMGYPGP